MFANTNYINIMRNKIPEISAIKLLFKLTSRKLLKSSPLSVSNCRILQPLKSVQYMHIYIQISFNAM